MRDQNFLKQIKINVKYLLAAMRKNPVINAVVRTSLKSVNKITNGKLDPLLSRWRVSGIIPLHFGTINFKMFAACDDFIIEKLYYQQQYIEYTELNFFIMLAKQSRVIFDVGANTGLYSILGSKCMPAIEGSVIYAFEPHKSNMERLLKNISLNNIKNVIPVEAAVGEKEELIPFTIPADNRITDVSSADGDFSRRRYQQKITWTEIKVQQYSLDHFSQLNNINGIDLMKVDVEGYEIPVFKGALKAIKLFNPVIICEVFFSEDKKTFFDSFLQECNYSIYELRKDHLVLMEGGMAPLKEGTNFVFAPFKVNSGDISFEDFLTRFMESRIRGNLLR